MQYHWNLGDGSDRRHSVACDALVTQCLWNGGMTWSSFQHGMIVDGDTVLVFGLVKATEPQCAGGTT